MCLLLRKNSLKRYTKLKFFLFTASVYGVESLKIPLLPLLRTTYTYFGINRLINGLHKRCDLAPL